MIGTIAIKLTSVTVKGYFPAQLNLALNLEETLITGATGVLTVSFYPIPYPPLSPPEPQPGPLSAGSLALPVVPRGVRYYLQVNGGNRTNPLRLGQLVLVIGTDDEKKLL